MSKQAEPTKAREKKVTAATAMRKLAEQLGTESHEDTLARALAVRDVAQMRGFTVVVSYRPALGDAGTSVDVALGEGVPIGMVMAALRSGLAVAEHVYRRRLDEAERRLAEYEKAAQEAEPGEE
jgi:hypothetical protein